MLVVLPYYTANDTSGIAAGVTDDGHVIVGGAGGLRGVRGAMDRRSGFHSARQYARRIECVRGFSAWFCCSGWYRCSLPMDEFRRMDDRRSNHSGYGDGHGISADGSVVVGAIPWLAQLATSRLDGRLQEGSKTSAESMEATVKLTPSVTTAAWLWVVPPAAGRLSCGPKQREFNLSRTCPYRPPAGAGHNGDGKVIVGGSDAAYAYRWRNGVVNYKIGFGEAKAVSDDGNFVVGDAYGSGGWVWTPTRGNVSDLNYISSLGLSLPSGFNNPVFTAMTPDATTLVGDVTNAAGNTQAFFIAIPEPPTAAIICTCGSTFC